MAPRSLPRAGCACALVAVPTSIRKLPMSKPPRAFIIHGHDLDARDELAEFVHLAGLDVLHFDLAEREHVASKTMK
jgi:hypothetical protein